MMTLRSFPPSGTQPLRALRIAGLSSVVAVGIAVGTARPAAAQCTDATPGYPVSATWVDNGPADTLFLGSLARAAAFRWQTPSPGRRRFARWRQVRSRALPPEPRWADDWKPAPRHTAVLAVTLFRDARAPTVVERTASGDRPFDQSLRSAFDDPMPQTPPLPAFPAGVAADSLRVELHFGAVPASGTYRTTRFAAQQRPAQLVPGSLRVSGEGFRQPRATVKYDVGANGRVVPGSFEVLDASDPGFGRAVGDALARASFTPAESNCRPIVHTVLQTFGG